MKGQFGACQRARIRSVPTGAPARKHAKWDSVNPERKSILSPILSSRGDEKSVAGDRSLTLVKRQSFSLLNKCQSERTTNLDLQKQRQQSKDNEPAYRDEEMIQKLYEWSKAYGGKAVVPKNVHDGQQLGSWLRKVRKLKGVMTREDVEKLDRAGMVWEMGVLESKWFSNFHLAREYQECHPGCDVDLEMTSEFDHPDRSDWVEASRWLVRQKALYRKQKLTRMKVRLLKNVLGVKLTREYSKPRKNIHSVIHQENAWYEKRMAELDEESGVKDTY